MSANSHKPAKVSRELANAAYDDFKRKAIDEAKKRAVSQRVDYDTFKNMVLTAHLKPITALSIRPDDRRVPCWSFGADGKPVKEQDGVSQLPTISTTDQLPCTSSDFYRDWRRLPSADDKYRYLVRCGPDTLRALFRVEVSAEVLRELLGVLEACWLGHGGAAEEAEGGEGAAVREAAFVVRTLEALAAAGRFSLTVKLLGSAARPVLDRLFSGLDAAAAAAGGGTNADATGSAAGDQAAEGAVGAGDGDGSGATTVESAAATTGGVGGICDADRLAVLRRVYGVA